MWKSGGTVISGWLTLGNRVTAEAMAQCGWDALTIDVQHGTLEYGDVLGMIQAIDVSGIPTLVRAPWNEPGIIMKLLDAGAAGVICPGIETAEDCRRFVGACKYPPKGYRSHAGTRALGYGGGGQSPASINRRVLAIAMIESLEALENLDAILATPGLSGIFIGPNDLCLSMTGSGGIDHEDGPVRDAIWRIIAACKARRMPVGLYCGGAIYAARMAAQGVDFIALASDLGLMTSGARRLLSELKSGNHTSAEKK